MNPRLSAVLSSHDLPAAELQAARLDGEVYCVDECFSPIDEIDDAAHRAGSLRTLVPRRLIAARETAAWVHGVLINPPVVHHFWSNHDARARPNPSPRLDVRELVLLPSDIVILGGMQVTTPLRTAIDILRFTEHLGRRESAAVPLLSEQSGLSLRELREHILALKKTPGKHKALAALALVREGHEHLSGHTIDVVDRVDASNRIEHSVEVRGVAHLEDEPADS
ncbi:hypothetical protein [Homoserinimonas hongtaonis]|uniref:hypothetical protein n=1 Tax=Homoserinimonas hongtaonis TaxID=2079791 RepID=UPI00131F3D6B|nr:hypothetical protein [Salinibacterium hongtaonis]